MSKRVIHVPAFEVLPGRIDDALALFKEIKDGAKDAAVEVLISTSGGNMSEKVVVRTIFPNAEAMVKAAEQNYANIATSWRKFHSADSPVKALGSGNWVPLI